MITDKELVELEKLVYDQTVEKAKTNLLDFTKVTFKKFEPTEFHTTYYDILDRFLKKGIKNLIISVPPQHGKSEGSSRRLPAAICGARPDDKIALVCYAATKAQKFGRETISIMREPEYKDIFPDVRYPERGYPGTKANTNENRESINSEGSMKFVGVDGALTGDPVDVLIMDDLYKNWLEANSPVISQKVWDWYISVADTRLHNDSQQLIVFTRWSDHDLIARLEEKGLVKTLQPDQDIDELIDSLEDDEWLKINFQALKEDEKTQIDNREEGEALWPSRHSVAKLESTRKKDPIKFSCLHQGDPEVKEGMLYNEFGEWKELPPLKIMKNYTDTADEGADNLCSINYGVPLQGNFLYVTDVLYTTDNMEKTEPLTIKMLENDRVRVSRIESNNGGKGFARVIDSGTSNNVTVKWFHQSKNKFARIYSNSTSVNRTLLFPEGWKQRWPKFYKSIRTYKKENINKHDDAEDTITGVYESEYDKPKKASVTLLKFN